MSTTRISGPQPPHEKIDEILQNCLDRLSWDSSALEVLSEMPDDFPDDPYWQEAHDKVGSSLLLYRAATDSPQCVAGIEHLEHQLVPYRQAEEQQASTVSRTARSQIRDKRLWKEFLQLLEHFDSLTDSLDDLCARDDATDAWKEAFSVVHETMLDVCEIAGLDYNDPN